jgi:hypothetical protein
MANELTVTANINYSKSGDVYSRNSGQIAVTISGTARAGQTQAIPTSDTTLTIPAAPGYVYIKNLDATNYVQVGPDATNWFLRVKAGQIALFPIEGTAMHMKANTATVNVEWQVFSL